MVFFLAFSIQLGVSRAEENASLIGVLVSKNIKPYLEAVDGIMSLGDYVSGSEIHIFPPEIIQENKGADFEKDIKLKNYKLFVAVGPEAGRFLIRHNAYQRTQLIYAMVLNPQRIFKETDSVCGVPLNIPISRQLNEIRLLIPKIRSLGVIYNPAFNRELMPETDNEYENRSINLIPMQVSSQKEIPGVLMKKLSHVDGILFVPDQTVISETIVEYIIKECLIHGKPTIGFNRFFHETGSLMSFVFDYTTIGRQAGRLAADILKGGPCRSISPEFENWVNQRVAERLKIEVKENSNAAIRLK